MLFGGVEVRAMEVGAGREIRWDDVPSIWPCGVIFGEADISRDYYACCLLTLSRARSEEGTGRCDYARPDTMTSLWAYT
jgi:hypothetical protein